MARSWCNVELLAGVEIRKLDFGPADTPSPEAALARTVGSAGRRACDLEISRLRIHASQQTFVCESAALFRERDRYRMAGTSGLVRAAHRTRSAPVIILGADSPSFSDASARSTHHTEIVVKPHRGAKIAPSLHVLWNLREEHNKLNFLRRRSQEAR